MIQDEISPLLFERYELKYLIPISLAELIIKEVKQFCELDYYSKISPDHYYTINSLYFDSPSFTFLRRKEDGASKRYNVRIRAYGDFPKPPYFFEVKEKTQDFVKKRRAKVNCENLELAFQDQNLLANSIDANSKENLDLFLNICDLYSAQPIVFTQYKRLALFSTIDDYARITFDKELKSNHQTEVILDPNKNELEYYDQAEIYKDTQSMIVMELKCESRVPLWMLDLIQRYQLNRVGFSKYQNGLRRAYSNQWVLKNTLDLNSYF